jgi:hypothetical protein
MAPDGALTWSVRQDGVERAGSESSGDRDAGGERPASAVPAVVDDRAWPALSGEPAAEPARDVAQEAAKPAASE